MSESPTDPPAGNTNHSDDEAPTKRIGTLGMIGAGFVVLVMVAGLIVSLVVLNRDDDSPLVPADGANASGPATPGPDNAGQFEPDPTFDSLQRVVYVPKNPNGVVLKQTPGASGRSADVAPSGVMLQRIHNNMVLPFSTSDGPTAIDSSGVATGFAHTPQGAALAAAHYTGYFSSGNDRIDMLTKSGHAADPANVSADLKAFNIAGGPAAVDNSTAVAALPSVRVNYTDALARVWFGYSTTMKDGSTQYRRVYSDFTWRDDQGWVLQVRKPNSPEGPTIGGSVDNRPFEPGWSTWW